MMKMETSAGVNVSTRLRELKAEYEQAQAKLIELDRHRQELRDGLLRVAGAIQVLEEFSENDTEVSSNVEPDAQTHEVKPKLSKVSSGSE